MEKSYETAAEKQAAYRLRKREKEGGGDRLVSVEPFKGVGRPEGATDAEWRYALERAERARRYAEKMPEHVRMSEVVFQDPVWQWENETRGRCGGRESKVVRE